MAIIRSNFIVPSPSPNSNAIGIASTHTIPSPTLSAQSQIQLVPSPTLSDPSPTLPIPSPTPPDPSPTTPDGANIEGDYTGTIHNTWADITSTMTLSVAQNQEDINGLFTVALPLQGSGPFTGNVDANGNIKFLVTSNDTKAPILFWGTQQLDGSLSGGYCSVNQSIQCDTNSGGRGDWNVARN